VTAGHVDTPPPAPAVDIPPVVKQVPIIAAPEPVEPLQTFTVVATDLPASELLFALARDARLNLDIDPSIDARVSINAIDQTLPQILQRISRQASFRYYLDGPNLVVPPRTWVSKRRCQQEGMKVVVPVIRRPAWLARRVTISGNLWKVMSAR
jgi:general secretion pathway protein D